MYNIPENYNFDIFKGKQIQQICYSISNILICFDSNLCISFNSEFRIEINGENYEYAELYPVKHDYQLLNMLEETVNRVGVKEDELLIIFDNGQIIALYNNPHYESFSIVNGNDTLII